MATVCAPRTRSVSPLIAALVFRLRDDNAVPCNDRRVVLAPFAGVAVNKEKNAALAVIMGWLVIKGDTISPVLVVKAIFFFNFNLPHPIQRHLHML